MAKIIKITESIIDEIRQDFEKALTKTNMADGKFQFTKTISEVKAKATIYFSERSWQKMHSLIREFDKEVAWHGIARRGENDDTHQYFIDDILVYPQEVTGVTVTTDQKEYEKWLMNHEDDVFNNIRMQGHSHVNMGVSPSSTDETLYKSILDQLDETMFYIFMIWNKKSDNHIKIYDLKKNILFTNSDCEVVVIEDENGVEKLIKDARKLVKEKTHTPVMTYKSTNGYWDSLYNYHQSQTENFWWEDKKKTDIKSTQEKEIGSIKDSKKEKTPTKKMKRVRF